MNVSDIGIDLGTASILIYVRGKGVVLKEPSVVAYDRDADKIRAIGDEARIMLSRTTGNIVAIRPLKNGIIADYAVTEQMLKYLGYEKLTREVLEEYVQGIYVYDDGRVEMEWKFSKDIAK